MWGGEDDWMDEGISNGENRLFLLFVTGSDSSQVSRTLAENTVLECGPIDRAVGWESGTLASAAGFTIDL